MIHQRRRQSVSEIRDQSRSQEGPCDALHLSPLASGERGIENQMKLSLSIILAVTALHSQTGARYREFEAGREYYAEAEFSKAAARFHGLCDRNNDAEACYWSGMSYQGLADVWTPLGCRTYAKARHDLSKATKLDPYRPEYRDALFDFLLDTSDCSRTALREAASILSGLPDSDPDYGEMSRRLEDGRRFNGSASAHLARLFLIVPRATYDIAALPSAVLSKPKASGHCTEVSCGSLEASGAGSARPSFETACAHDPHNPCVRTQRDPVR
jgi:tetratricopeptide (TPR) repeat protein